MIVDIRWFVGLNSFPGLCFWMYSINYLYRFYLPLLVFLSVLILSFGSSQEHLLENFQAVYLKSYNPMWTIKRNGHFWFCVLFRSLMLSSLCMIHSLWLSSLVKCAYVCLSLEAFLFLGKDAQVTVIYSNMFPPSFLFQSYLRWFCFCWQANNGNQREPQGWQKTCRPQRGEKGHGT